MNNIFGLTRVNRSGRSEPNAPAAVDPSRRPIGWDGHGSTSTTWPVSPATPAVANSAPAKNSPSTKAASSARLITWTDWTPDPLHPTVRNHFKPNSLTNLLFQNFGPLNHTGGMWQMATSLLPMIIGHSNLLDSRLSRKKKSRRKCVRD